MRTNMIRVIPRDLFNDANLLKCYGQLYLNLDNMGMADCLTPDESVDSDGFVILQNENTGGTFISNISLVVHGLTVHLERPLNSREAYPMYLTTPDGSEIEVFNEDGSFTEEMIEFLS